MTALRHLRFDLKCILTCFAVLDSVGYMVVAHELIRHGPSRGDGIDGLSLKENTREHCLLLKETREQGENVRENEKEREMK